MTQTAKGLIGKGVINLSKKSTLSQKILNGRPESKRTTGELKRMQYFVKGEFVEENIAGKSFQDTATFIRTVVHPSLLALDRATREGKGIGGVGAGERAGYIILEAPNHEAVGKFLRDLPFWGALKWTIVPLQTFQSAVEQDLAAIENAKQMMPVTQ